MQQQQQQAELQEQISTLEQQLQGILPIHSQPVQIIQQQQPQQPQQQQQMQPVYVQQPPQQPPLMHGQPIQTAPGQPIYLPQQLSDPSVQLHQSMPTQLGTPQQQHQPPQQTSSSAVIMHHPQQAQQPQQVVMPPQQLFVQQQQSVPMMQQHPQQQQQPIQSTQTTQTLPMQQLLQQPAPVQAPVQQQPAATPPVTGTPAGAPASQAALPKRLTNELKKRRNQRSTERNPKLHVLGYENNIIECEMENRAKKIKFKFDPTNVNTVEVAQDLVSSDLLSESQTTIFIEMVRDIQRQLKENPNQLPVASQCYRRSSEKRDETSTTASNFTHIFDPTIIERQALGTGISSTTTSSTSSSPLSQQQPASTMTTSQTNGEVMSSLEKTPSVDGGEANAPVLQGQNLEGGNFDNNVNGNGEQQQQQQMPAAATITSVLTMVDDGTNDNNSSCDENSRKASTVSTDYTSHENTPENTITSASNLSILQQRFSIGEQNGAASEKPQPGANDFNGSGGATGQELEQNPTTIDPSEHRPQSISTSVPSETVASSEDARVVSNRPEDGGPIVDTTNQQQIPVAESSSQSIHQPPVPGPGPAAEPAQAGESSKTEEGTAKVMDGSKIESPSSEQCKTPVATTPQLKQRKLSRFSVTPVVLLAAAGATEQSESLTSTVDTPKPPSFGTGETSTGTAASVVTDNTVPPVGDMAQQYASNQLLQQQQSSSDTNALSAMVSPHPAPYPMQPGGANAAEASQQQLPQQVVFYQSQEYIVSDPNYSASEGGGSVDQSTARAQEFIVEGTSYAAVVAGEFQQQPIAIAADQSNAELQQKLFASRRTSSEMNSLSADAAAAPTGASTVATDSGTPNVATVQREQEKQLSNQSSIDRIDSSGSLAGLQLKLSQLTVGAESPRAAVSTDPLSLHPQQQSTVTSPSVEQAEPKFANEAKPLIRKVSRFQVQTVQESPRVPPTDVQPQRKLAMTTNPQEYDSQNCTAFSSPTDEKSCQTLSALQQQQQQQ
uniref:Serine/threonine-protein kinase WNK CCTL2 domain-containing protein n=1 Tax=Anopheles atroparvus TaxID=41427 RepID=A0A182IWC7_ANOAO